MGVVYKNNIPYGGSPNIVAAAGAYVNEPGTPSVTASTVNGVTTFTFNYLKGQQGIQGEQGPVGPDGQTGQAAGFGTPTATIDSNVGTPGVTVSASGPDSAKVFEFAFTNLKGEPGVSPSLPSDNITGTGTATQFAVFTDSHELGSTSIDKSDVGLSNVGNFKAVSTEGNQGLTTTEQANARTNIGAGTSSFSGSYNDLTNTPSLATVATSGSYNDLSNTPTLGTAAAKDTTNTYDASGTDPVTGQAVAAALETLPDPMVFKGSLGTGGTIDTLPSASLSNAGFTYKVIIDGTYASQAAKVGDQFISDGTTWVHIPSGDEPSGTVTSVGLTQGNGITVTGGPITTSGSITVALDMTYFEKALKQYLLGGDGTTTFTSTELEKIRSVLNNVSVEIS